MTPYESGFDAGERQAFKDRHNGVRRVFSERQDTGYAAGYRDGYTPHDASWWRGATVQAWWQDRESEIE
jgi:hypothetical protein